MKTHLQCGYENCCKNKDCLKCNRRKRKSLSLTQAEETIIEDFAMCDLEVMKLEKPKVFDLMQKIMYKLMMKVFREDKDDR